MKLAGARNKGLGLGVAPLLQPDRADQRDQVVVDASRQQGANQLVCCRVIAGLQILPGPGDGGVDDIHGLDAFG
jgi:hypothetical protein